MCLIHPRRFCMRKYPTILLVSACALACFAQAPASTPSANPLVAEAKGAYNRVKANILGAAEKMPEENYSFAPTKDERPFIQVVAHVAVAQTGTCSLVKGERKTSDADTKKTKADVIVALKASFDLCDSVFDSLTDASATEITQGRSKLGRLWGNTGHDMEQYASMSGYLRQKNIAPPSSEAPKK